MSPFPDKSWTPPQLALSPQCLALFLPGLVGEGMEQLEARLLLFLGFSQFAQKFPHRAKLLSVLYLSTFLRETEKNNVSKRVGHLSSAWHVPVEYRSPNGETNQETITQKVIENISPRVILPYPKHCNVSILFLNRLM